MDYTINQVTETKYDPDQYGNVFYSIKFAETAESVLWKTPNKPEIGQKVFGNISRTKSGKGWIFKKAQKLEDYVPHDPSEQPGSVQVPAQEPTQGSNQTTHVPTQLDRIEQKLDKVLYYIRRDELPEGKTVADVILEDIEDGDPL